MARSFILGFLRRSPTNEVSEQAARIFKVVFGIIDRLQQYFMKILFYSEVASTNHSMQVRDGLHYAAYSMKKNRISRKSAY